MQSLSLSPSLSRRTWRVITPGLLSLGAVVALLLQPLPGNAQSAPVTAKQWVEKPAATARAPQPRLALVIGNTHYGGTHELKNPENDARAVATALKGLGFTATVLLDGGRGRMREEVHAFCDRIRAAGPQAVALLYYSGHGMQVAGENYLIPVGFEIPVRADDMGDNALSAQKILDEVQGANAQVSIAVLDACRDNPYATQRAFAGSRGLAKLEAEGLYIAFATASGKTAEDNPNGSNGMYTTELLHFLKTPGLSVDQVFKKTRAAVFAKTNHAQFPYVYDGLLNSETFILSEAPSAEADTTAHVTVTVNAPNAKIVLAGQTLVPGVTTDIDLGGEKTKTVELQASADNYKTVVKDVTLTGGLPAPIDLTLEKIEDAIHQGGGSTPATKVNPKDGAVMIWIPPGPFLMGDADQYLNLRHTVTLSGYYIYKNLVTVAMYRKFCEATSREMPSSPSWGWKEDHPMVKVSWDDAKAYCDWAGVSLPTEAQWEKAARGTDGRKYPWGNDFDKSKLWCSKSTYSDADRTAPVGSFPGGASPYGVLDMAGNVDQWCADWYDDRYWDSAPSQDPTGPGFAKDRVTRGGSWFEYDAKDFCAADRGWLTPTNGGYACGFRCASVSP